MITYCTNIHPGETWQEIFQNLKAYVLSVKEAFLPHSPFPVGLYLSARAAEELVREGLAVFGDWLLKHNLFVSTLNGFPYGNFHGKMVKEGVYLPDWRTEERANYTKILVDILAHLLPAGMKGSISTVPVAFRKAMKEEDYPLVRRHLFSVLTHIDGVREETGKDIVLALEPEPGCVLETMEDLSIFFERLALPQDLRDTLGICLDLCHQAVVFAAPEEIFSTIGQANIPIGKIQISAGLSLKEKEIDGLAAFESSPYLHHVAIKDEGGTIFRYSDIPVALKCHQRRGKEEWRVHLHVPIYAEGINSFSTTQSFILASLPYVPKDTLLEVETYTWGKLIDDKRTDVLVNSIVRELNWLKGALP